MKKISKLLLVTVLLATITVFVVACTTPTKITLNKTKLTLNVGQQETLTATISPEREEKLTWTSSDEKVAKVVDGKVTALAQGTATITVSLDKQRATCKVTVIKPAPAWEGNVATSQEMQKVFDKEANVYSISTPEQLAWISAVVNSNDSSVRDNFAGKTIKLVEDVNLNNKNWTPIGDVSSYPSKAFAGTFDGNGKTIFNLKIDVQGAYATASLFGSTIGATIKNLTIDGATITSEHYAGAIVGYSGDSTATTTITSCTVKNTTVTSLPALVGGAYDNGDKVGGIAGLLQNATITKCIVTDSKITAYRNVGGIVGYITKGSVSGNTLKNTTITQDDTNGYKDANDVEKLVDKLVGNINDVDSKKPSADFVCQNNISTQNVVVVNKDVEKE